MITKFTNNKEIKTYINRIPIGKRYSDIEDQDGYQYVDLVQEGGGVLGIALVGYTYILEKAGIRFMSLAGTSAGAINTLMMAGLGNINQPKSEKILEILAAQDLFELVDGDKRIKRLIDKAINKEKGLIWSIIRAAIPAYKAMKNKYGLNPGSFFEKWITEELAKNNIHNLQDLMDLRNELPKDLIDVTKMKKPKDIEAKLAIIASDVTTHSKMEFPKMTELYWSEPSKVTPAKLVRASMSVPFFFEPFEVKNIPNAGNAKDSKWIEFTKYYGPVPPSAKFVDGGMLSNFPINVFHRENGGIPRMPTFGVRLSTFRQKHNDTSSFLKFNGAMINTMRQIFDYDFLLRNPDYKHLICMIDADQEFNWLNFNMTRPRQIELFNLGAKKAVEFLEGFDWENYKEIRKQVKKGVIKEKKKE